MTDSWGVVVDQARRPTDAELRRNSRARSAVLHVHRKSRGTILSDLEAKAEHCFELGASCNTSAGKKKKKRVICGERRKKRRPRRRRRRRASKMPKKAKKARHKE